MTSESQERLYRFAPRDRGGWILGLGGSQCIALALAILTASTFLNAGAPAPLVLSPVLLGFTFTFVRIGGVPVHELVPVVIAWVVGRRGRPWIARLPLLTGSAGDEAGQPDLPPCLAGLAILDVPAKGWAGAQRLRGIGIVSDDRDGALSGILRVRGREFALLDRAEQERMVAGWGDALGGFCKERSAVARVTWCEWAAPAGLSEQLRYVEEHRAAPLDSPAVQSYLSLLDDAGPMSTSHEVLVTVTVELRRVRRPRSGGGGDDPKTVAVEVLLEELRLLTARLEAASLAVDPPLSPVEIAAAIRTRCDPRAAQTLATRRRSLAQLAGVVSVHNAGPLATRAHRSWFEVDGACHATYLIAEWPRLDVPPNWMEPLLLHAGGVRTVCVGYEPVPPSRSARRVNRDATRLASDAELRDRKGFRVGAQHRRAQAAVAERESELVAGYPELEHVGLITVTGADPESLERSCAEYEQVAAQAQMELRRLDRQHDLAFVATLPLGRMVEARRL